MKLIIFTIYFVLQFSRNLNKTDIITTFSKWYIKNKPWHSEQIRNKKNGAKPSRYVIYMTYFHYAALEKKSIAAR
jgi:hypothetical protein